ncbi:MAG: exodeoxyribonuclease VII large subunit [Alphaproteobacteria bacterium]|nr:MAG: exodeoxyribonuclease VII large subunit [Alphaproteobacteria bacterium]
MAEDDKDILSIKEIATLIKNCVEINFSNVKIQGEISGYKQHTSGHHYFALKDQDAVLDAICWRGTQLAIPLQEGQEVVAIGRITTYPMRSKYQIIVEQILPKGEGALQALLKERTAYYKKLGYFERKRPLPKFPQTVGVVTSETGAVIRDILHRISDRFPIRVILWPVTVQGPGAKEEVAKAIHGFNALDHKPDVLIVGRGGGSLEDLWAFNEPEVLEAAFKSDIPIVSAVGHETDVTLLDYVADKRAPTPTGAAEMVVPSRLDLLQDLGQWNNRLLLTITNQLKHKFMHVKMIKVLSPEKIVENWQMRLDDLSERLELAVKTAFDAKQGMKIKMLYDTIYFKVTSLIDRKKQNFTMFGTILEQNSVNKTLKRGFCIPTLSDGHVARYEDLKKDDQIELKFYEGLKKAVIS